MAEISFWGGVGIIGSSKVLIEQGPWRVLLDFGMDFTPGSGLFRNGVRARPDFALYDRLRTGQAPLLPHIYRPEALHGFSLPAGSDGHTAVFITHAHIDHIGLTGWLDPNIPIYCSPETRRLMEALAEAGDVPEGYTPEFKTIDEEKPVIWGPFRVTRYPVDHDVVGASGYAVETEDGVVAFTGDIRLHGRHPEFSESFARSVRKARALVIEGTSLSFGFTQAQRPETEVDASFSHALQETPGLVLLSLYPRNLERVESFITIARQAGRRIVWPKTLSVFFRNWGLQTLCLSPFGIGAPHRSGNWPRF